VLTSKLSSGNARRVAGTAAILGAAGALTIAFAPTGNAAEPRAEVTVQIKQNGNYTATLCAADILEGRCEFGVKKGQTRTFTVNPRNGSDPIELRVVVDGGGSEFRNFTAGNADQLSFVTGGSKQNPTIEQVK
jgi:hypothetical protein